MKKVSSAGARFGGRGQLWKEIYRYRYLYLILSFGIIYFLVFHYGPMYGLQLAFKKYSIREGITGSPLVGLDNFRVLFGRSEFWSAFKNTIIISLLKTAFFFPAPIILAIVLNDVRSPGACRVLQTIFSLPHFLSWVTIAGIMTHLLSSSGAVNALLGWFGVEPVPFLSNGPVFRILLVFSEIWKESGWQCIIYMAAIAGIDPALYESASLDGASRLQRAMYVTFPCLRTTCAVMLILSVGSAMSSGFDQIINMYNPTVISSADIIDTYIYRITFKQAPNYGLSTAAGLFKGVCNCVLLLTANFVVGKIDKDSKMI